MQVINFLIAIFIGALIGLQREHSQKQEKMIHFAGIRTFVLISLFGAILGYISITAIGNYYLVIVGFIVVALLALSSYFLSYFRYKNTGSTTEVAAILMFIIGLMCTIGFLSEAIILGIVIAAILTFKETLHGFANKLKQQEIVAIVSFALISLVVLPLLPNQEFSPLDVPVLSNVLLSMGISEATLAQLDVFNPHSFWLMVILVAGISFLGYILVKSFGTKKGYGLAGLVGGLISSTAVTLSMAGESKKYKKITMPFVIAVVIASATSFIRVLIEVIVINNKIVSLIAIPLGIMGLVGYISAFVLYIKKEKIKEVKKIDVEQPFNLITALKFGLLFVLVIFIARLAQVLAGTLGIYIASIFSGLVDVDAITLTMASLSKLGEISPRVAVTSIIFAVSSNTLVKAAMAWIVGEKRFAKYVSIIFLLILAVGLTLVGILF